MSDRPLVSVVIPCFQAEPFVREALESVLAQSYENLEILGIDDGSTDSTLSTLRDYAPRVTVLRHPGGGNLGVSLSRKLGVDHSRGKYIAFLDADDSFVPEKLELQVAWLEDHPRSVLCHTAITTVPEASRDIELEGWFAFAPEALEYDYRKRPNYLRANGICNSTVMIRAEVLRALPFAGRQLFQYEDWLTWCLAAEQGLFSFLPQRTVNYRLHPHSSTSSVNSSRLTNLYSGVEFYLSLAARTGESKTREQAVDLLAERLGDLFAEYRGEGQAPVKQEARAIFERALARHPLRKYLHKLRRNR